MTSKYWPQIMFCFSDRLKPMKMRIVWADKARTFLLKIQKSYSPQVINNSSKEKKCKKMPYLTCNLCILYRNFPFFIDENTLEIFVYKHRIFQFQMNPIHSAYTFNLWIQVVCKKDNMLKKEYLCVLNV